VILFVAASSCFSTLDFGHGGFLLTAILCLIHGPLFFGRVFIRPLGDFLRAALGAHVCDDEVVLGGSADIEEEEISSLSFSGASATEHVSALLGPSCS